jgi:hypothetical protein
MLQEAATDDLKLIGDNRPVESKTHSSQSMLLKAAIRCRSAALSRVAVIFDLGDRSL